MQALFTVVLRYDIGMTKQNIPCSCIKKSELEVDCNIQINFISILSDHLHMYMYT